LKILCKLGEIILKGLNRNFFEKQLVRNLQAAIGESYQISRSQGVIFIDVPNNEQLAKEIAAKASKVFGIVNLSICRPCEKNLDSIKAKSKQLCAGLSGTFKVEAKRSDKNFPLTSPQISIEVGGFLDDVCPNLTPDMHNPDYTIEIEIRDSEAYISCEKLQGAGGLPVGTSGKATLLLSGGIDSPVAGYMMAKRGIALEAVHFHSYPYTSLQAKQKVIDLARIMSRYCGNFRLHIVPFTDIQLQINQHCPTDQSTIIMRVFMMQIAARIASRNGSEALITGECLAQVASQTLQSLAITNSSIGWPTISPPTVGDAVPDVPSNSTDFPSFVGDDAHIVPSSKPNIHLTSNLQPLTSPPKPNPNLTTNNYQLTTTLRPLIGMDKEEIVNIARKIGTFETSILPFEDCCTVFTPKHPTTKPKLEKIMLSQSLLDVESLIEYALDNIETVHI